ncbi:hypothetical protein B0E33_20440 [Roseibium algicola]|jgi:hypothetical protein|uniref:Uncharacterized protein n=1 Tax=Roseibium algicola TaxID=2857014 RepID=A0ABM6I5F0_9HYPH|nr:hypothetical protein ACP90_08400 [Labrenzia sp. CP4]AQQ05643.1 hypothetical protein B0E33_20440 [Roseibium aggregatum]
MINEFHLQTWRTRKPPTFSEHRFAVGQFVRMRNDPPMVSTSRGGSFHITALMPRTGDIPQYRTRNDLELHECMVIRDELEPVGISETTQDNALLITKTSDLR